MSVQAALVEVIMPAGQMVLAAVAAAVVVVLPEVVLD
jgi:hypothetical protein